MAFFISKTQTYQNLVPNGSFETFTNCPTGSDQIFYSNFWSGPTINSSDYFNACSQTKNVPYYGGVAEPYYYLPAKDGAAYAAIYFYQPNNYREYLEAKLLQPLTSGFCYYIEFYAANCQYVKYKTNNIAASFSSTNNPTNLSYPGSILNLPLTITSFGNKILEDTVNWKKIAGIYSATGNEQYIVIGNFKDDSQTDTVNIYQPGQTAYYGPSLAYVFIDAVSVFSINPTGNLPWKYRDTTIVEGDSVYIGNTMGGNFNPQWFTIGGNYIATNAGIYVKPVVTTSYVVNYTVCGTSRADTVEVKVVSDIGIREKLLKKMEFKVFPNPANDEIIIEFETEFSKPKAISITDITGRIIKTTTIVQRRQRVDISDLESGCYFVSHQNASGFGVTKKIIKQ